ncbi:MAG: AAA family ATPase [Gammaproteobacteria bacterium]|nr:AAA family ATPase [Gammaproteobacteria bacterium]
MNVGTRHERGDEERTSVLFLFGLAGSGKNYVADIISRRTDYHHYDADNDITDEMREALEQGRPFTDAIRDRYFKFLADRILDYGQQYPRLLVTQAVYRRRHRKYLLDRIPNLLFVYIQADESVISKRLSTRKEGIDLSTASVLRADFETPDVSMHVITNNGDNEQLMQQLSELLDSL